SRVRTVRCRGRTARFRHVVGARADSVDADGGDGRRQVVSFVNKRSGDTPDVLLRAQGGASTGTECYVYFVDSPDGVKPAREDWQKEYCLHEDHSYLMPNGSLAVVDLERQRIVVRQPPTDVAIGQGSPCLVPDPETPAPAPSALALFLASDNNFELWL